MQLLPNHILVRPDEGYDHVSIGNTRLQIDTSYEIGHHSISSGIVIAVPDRLVFNKNISHEISLRYDTVMEVQPGDRVICHYMAIAYALKHQMTDGNGNVFVKYDGLLARVRGNDVHPLNGIIIAEAIKEDVNTSSSIIIPDVAKNNDNKCKSKVLYVGTPLNGYHDFKELPPDEPGSIKPGDVIVHSQFDSVPLQYIIHQIIHPGAVLYRMHYKDVDCIIPPGETAATIGDRILSQEYVKELDAIPADTTPPPPERTMRGTFKWSKDHKTVVFQKDPRGKSLVYLDNMKDTIVV